MCNQGNSQVHEEGGVGQGEGAMIRHNRWYYQTNNNRIQSWVQSRRKLISVNENYSNIFKSVSNEKDGEGGASSSNSV